MHSAVLIKVVRGCDIIQHNAVVEDRFMAESAQIKHGAIMIDCWPIVQMGRWISHGAFVDQDISDEAEFDWSSINVMSLGK